MAWIADAPLALIGLAIIALLFLAMEAGFRSHGWLSRRTSAHGDQAAPDYLLSAMLGLLALLLGFTFALALNRYEARRDLVVQEANAIGTTWLRAQLLGEPARGRMTVLLRGYVDARLDWSRDPSPVASLTRTAALQQKLWAETGTAVRQDSSTQLSRALMEAMNDSFDRASERAAARRAHIPDEVLGILLLCAALSAGMLGTMMGATGRRSRAATTMLLLLVALALLMIFDLDRPVSGAIQVSQQSFEELRQSMQP